MTLSVHLIQMKQMVGLGVHDTHFLYYLRRVFSYTTSDHSTHIENSCHKTLYYLLKVKDEFSFLYYLFKYDVSFPILFKASIFLYYK